MLFAKTTMDVVNIVTKLGFLLCFVISFVFWVRNKCEGDALVYGYILPAGIVGMLLLLIVKSICWVIGLDGFWLHF